MKPPIPPGEDVPTLSLIPSAAPARLHTPPELASDQRILDRFGSALRVCGVVGEERGARLTYLCLVSRLLDEPVSLAIKGVSASGKSHTLEATSRFFPATAYIPMTVMSERALIYMKDSFAHRTLILYEAVALREQREKTESNLTAYFVRSLLSEGRIAYPVTVRDKAGNFVTKTIVKEGPTNLIVTTTATSLHGENETRLISLPTNDSADQTRAILRQLASGARTTVDFSEWHALQSWLEAAELRVTIPYAGYLAETVPPVAVRLRRDFRSILRLIETHAILHQLNRDRDDAGRIVASEEDYLAVRALVADLISDGVGATVSATIRETVAVVVKLAGEEGVGVRRVAETLNLDRSAASRRLAAAREHGYLTNLEDRRGRPARYVVGDPMPEEQVLLPHTCTPSTPETAGQQGVCSDAGVREGEAPPATPLVVADTPGNGAGSCVRCQRYGAAHGGEHIAGWGWWPMPDRDPTAAYEASPTRRNRSTQAEMAAFRSALYDLVEAGQPMTVRHAFYRAVATGLVDKSQTEYGRVQRQLVKMRRDWWTLAKWGQSFRSGSRLPDPPGTRCVRCVPGTSRARARAR